MPDCRASRHRRRSSRSSIAADHALELRTSMPRRKPLRRLVSNISQTVRRLCPALCRGPRRKTIPRILGPSIGPGWASGGTGSSGSAHRRPMSTLAGPADCCQWSACMHVSNARRPGIEEWIGSIAQRHGLVMLPEGSHGPACRGAEPRNRPASRGAPVEQFCQQTALSGTVLRAYRCAASHRMLTSRTVPLLCPSNNSPSNDAGIEGRPCELTRPEAQPSPRFRLLPADGREYMRPMARAALAHRAAGPGYSDRIDSNTTADSGG